MVYVKQIVCLANSRKTSGRCIAGREVTASNFGPWIRPVSNRNTREISEEERRYENGNRASVLDLISIRMLNPSPRHHHAEDHLIDEQYYWTKKGMADWRTVENLVEPLNGPLWVNGESTYYGRNDKIVEARASSLTSSLILLRPTTLDVHVKRENGFQGGSRRRVRAAFSIAGDTYLFQITDPVIEQKYLGYNDGTYPIGDAILCVSLSEPFEGYVFKLVATILTPDMAQ